MLREQSWRGNAPTPILIQIVARLGTPPPALQSGSASRSCTRTLLSGTSRSTSDCAQAVHRFLEGQPSMLERWKIDSKRLSRYTAQENLELAIKGNILIRGWGASYLLRSVPHVVCVRVCAPMALERPDGPEHHRHNGHQGRPCRPAHRDQGGIASVSEW